MKCTGIHVNDDIIPYLNNPLLCQCDIVDTWIFTSCGCIQVNGQLYRNVSRLMDQLLDEYDKRQRPVINQSHTVKVNVSFELLALQVSAIRESNN